MKAKEDEKKRFTKLIEMCMRLNIKKYIKMYVCVCGILTDSQSVRCDKNRIYDF